MKRYEIRGGSLIHTQPRNIRKDIAMQSNLKLFKFVDVDNEGPDVRWEIFVFAQDQPAANVLAIQEVARRMNENSEDDDGNTDSIPPEIGAQIIQAIASGDAEFGSPVAAVTPSAHLMLVKLIEE